MVGVFYLFTPSKTTKSYIKEENISIPKQMGTV